MQTHVFPTKFTRQGVENVQESPARTQEALETLESLGGTWSRST